MTVLHADFTRRDAADQRLVADFYDRVAPTYDRTCSTPADRAEDRALRRILRRLGVGASGTVVDLGCGTGLLVRLLDPSPAMYRGVDLSPGMLLEARTRHPRHVFVKRDMLDVLRAGVIHGEGAIVSLFGAVNYVRPDVLIPRAARVLAPGGTLFLMALRPGAKVRCHTPEMEGIFARNPWHSDEVLSLFSTFGLHTISVRPFGWNPAPRWFATSRILHRYETSLWTGSRFSVFVARRQK